MTVDRASLETQAERSLRRGELSEALSLFQSLAAAFPGDAQLAARIRDLSESLQPAELHRLPRDAADLPVPPPSDDPAQEGERLFALGNYAAAAASYRAAVAADPENDLLRERLEQLYQLALATSRPSANGRSGAPPPDPARVLSTLLDRISTRRRA